MLESLAPTMPESKLTAALNQLADGLNETLAELRDPARGLHPAILTTDGLEPALQQLAVRARFRSASRRRPTAFPSTHIETTAYFVAEALANVGEYSQATSASVCAQQLDGHLQITIHDNGVGGASVSPGSGLSGLADSVAAVGGRFTVLSPLGDGTRAVAELPLSGPFIGR